MEYLKMCIHRFNARMKYLQFDNQNYAKTSDIIQANHKLVSEAFLIMNRVLYHINHCKFILLYIKNHSIFHKDYDVLNSLWSDRLRRCRAQLMNGPRVLSDTSNIRNRTFKGIKEFLARTKFNSGMTSRNLKLWRLEGVLK